MRGIVLFALVASACSFTPGSFTSPGDASPDGPPPIIVGFAKTTTAADENSGVVQVRVVLSQPSSDAISVGYSVTGGTATPDVDFTGGSGTLAFAAGDVEELIELTIVPDAVEEADETIELTLSDVTGTGAGLGSAMHSISIAANVLPRVTFEQAASTGLENASPTINAVLDVASALTTSVDVTVMAGTATGGGVDYTLATTTVTFAPGETTKPVTLTVVDDVLDEDDETVTLELANATSVIIGTQATTMHTITDDDNAPTVAFATASSSVAETGTMTMVSVSLSGASGKTVTVPFQVDAASTATVTSDYTLGTASPLTFAPGELTKMIQVNIVNDTAVEGPETVILALGAPAAPTNATVGTPGTHTLTIDDDEVACLGTGNYAACLPTPTAALVLPGSIDTDSSPLCAAGGPVAGWTGGPSACFVVATSIGMAGTTTVTGSRPLVLFATGSVGLAGLLDVASHRGGTSGPGANLGCGAYTDAPDDDTSGAGGGAGGTFRTAGGNGGRGNSVTNSGGTALPASVTPPTTLRGGCTGQQGGDGFAGAGSTGGLGGAGGGALYIVAGDMIAVGTGSTINASGAGGDAVISPDSGLFGGGGGGGSGGMIVLQATSFSVSGARFMANGGGGSAGADDNTAGVDGSDPSTATPTAGGTGGSSGSAGGPGGGGFGSTTAVANGSNGGSNNAGGGGGGGGGYILSNLPLTGATVSAGEVAP